MIGYKDLAALPRDKAILDIERPDLMIYQPHYSYSPLEVIQRPLCCQCDSTLLRPAGGRWSVSSVPDCDARHTPPARQHCVCVAISSSVVSVDQCLLLLH